jgi:hypothetical protein
MKDIIIFWVSMVFVALVIFLLTGCAEKTVYVDRTVEVKVPVRCVITGVAPAIRGVNDADTLLGIIRERDELRASVEGCR